MHACNKASALLCHCSIAKPKSDSQRCRKGRPEQRFEFHVLLHLLVSGTSYPAFRRRAFKHRRAMAFSEQKYMGCSFLGFFVRDWRVEKLRIGLSNVA